MITAAGPLQAMVIIDLIITAVIVTAVTFTAAMYVRRWIMRARRTRTDEYWRMFARACEARCEQARDVDHVR